MQFDVIGAVGAVVREVRNLEHEGKPAQAVVASRTFPTDIADLWDAVTNIERIPRWFAPVTGDLELGGRYQDQGNAGGTVTACDPPESFALTWEFAGNTSWVTVTLKAVDAETTQLELVHLGMIDPAWAKQYGPGATGVGWDLGLFGLQLHIETGASVPPEMNSEWLKTDNYKDFVNTSSEGWRRAAVAAGTDPEAAASAAANTAAFYRGDAPREGSA